MSEKVVWGKEGQIVTPLDNGNIHWETFGDISPSHDTNYAKARQKGLTPCDHCWKGITDTSKAWTAQHTDASPHPRGEFLPNNATARDLTRAQAHSVILGPDCATNLPTSHRKRYRN